MELVDALAIVRDLANENVLEEYEARWAGLLKERTRQLEAMGMVDTFLAKVRKEKVRNAD